MDNILPMKLDLCAPLVYVKIDNIQENKINKELVSQNEEILICYAINSRESSMIEPDKEKFLDKLLFIGRKTPGSIPNEQNFSSNISEFVITALPAGKYLFNQYRAAEPLNQKEWLDMAIEQQKDGLWERYKLENMLYIRFLFEDGAFVTQVFRPLIKVNV